MERNIVVIGLPRTGKSTYLASLWHMLVAEELPSPLRLDSLRGNQSYVQNLRRKWLRCEELERTKKGQADSLRMALRDTDHESPFTLSIPDLSGEIYQDMWEKRECERSLASHIAGSDAGLLFVDPDPLEPTSLVEVRRALDEVREVDEEPGVIGLADEEVDVISWGYDKAPDQVKVVGLLQFLLADLQVSVPFRVGIIVSAWDLVKDHYSSPRKWIESRMPLLHQFLHSNSELLKFASFGVSAQGGRLPDERERLRGVDVPSERVFVTDGAEATHDLSVPVRWALIETA